MWEELICRASLQGPSVTRTNLCASVAVFSSPKTTATTASTTLFLALGCAELTPPLPARLRLQVKETLKSLKGSWNRGLQGWIFQANRREEVISALRKDPTNTVTESDKPAQPAAKQQKLDDDAFIDDSEE